MIHLIVPTLGTRELEFVRLLESLEKQTYSNFKLIVVSQDNHKAVEGLLNKTKLSFTHIPIDKKGLSLARNVGVQHIEDKGIVTFSDDDCWYPENALNMVNHYFENHKSIDVACFQIFDPNQQAFYKQYPKKASNKLNFFSLFKKSSIEIFVNINKVKKSNLRFDEKFGMGTSYPSGEENIFLTDLFKNGIIIGYEPEIIVYHKKKNNEIILDNRSIISKGPLFKRIFNTPKGIMYLTLFFIKKYKLIDAPLSTYFKTLKETIIYKK
jgi:glycosyltransferase involved in cell wall biosynthesis